MLTYLSRFQILTSSHVNFSEHLNLFWRFQVLTYMKYFKPWWTITFTYFYLECNKKVEKGNIKLKTSRGRLAQMVKRLLCKIFCFIGTAFNTAYARIFMHNQFSINAWHQVFEKCSYSSATYRRWNKCCRNKNLWMKGSNWPYDGLLMFVIYKLYYATLQPILQSDDVKSTDPTMLDEVAASEGKSCHRPRYGTYVCEVPNKEC